MSGSCVVSLPSPRAYQSAVPKVVSTSAKVLGSVREAGAVTSNPPECFSHTPAESQRRASAISAFQSLRRGAPYDVCSRMR